MMIETLQKVIDMVNSDQLNEDVLNYFNHPGIHIYSKDKNGRYLSCNDTMAWATKLNSSTDILGLTDSDLLWSEGAPLFRQNDQKIIFKEESFLFLESYSTLSDNESIRVNVLSYKKPLRTRSKKTTGIFGVTLLPGAHGLVETKHNNTNQWINDFKISRREHDCLYHLAYGKSAKQIAQQLNISHRTVEEYLANARKKLNCSNHSQLIEKIISLGIL